ncbi:MAG: hypothetical protein NVV74_09445 [Magnetospirillum sp.]|nr:hypothetical protein [Magnetospirillum sp.]
MTFKDEMKAAGQTADHKARPMADAPADDGGEARDDIARLLRALNDDLKADPAEDDDLLSPDAGRKAERHLPIGKIAAALAAAIGIGAVVVMLDQGGDAPSAPPAPLITAVPSAPAPGGGSPGGVAPAQAKPEALITRAAPAPRSSPTDADADADRRRSGRTGARRGHAAHGAAADSAARAEGAGTAGPAAARPRRHQAGRPRAAPRAAPRGINGEREGPGASAGFDPDAASGRARQGPGRRQDHGDGGASGHAVGPAPAGRDPASGRRSAPGAATGQAGAQDRLHPARHGARHAVVVGAC